MKKVVKIFSVALSVIVLLAIVSLCGCANDVKDPWTLKQEDQGFYYYVIGDNGKAQDKYNEGTKAVILGFKDENFQADELVIPESLGGFPVTKIGRVWQTLGIGGPTPEVYYGLDVSKVNRIIINHNIHIPSYGIKDFSGDIVLNSIVEYLDFDSVRDCHSIQINTEINFIDILSDYDKYFYSVLNNYEIYEIKYEAVGGKQKTFITALHKGELLPEPEEPTKEGYIFTGWFTDENYETEWNFEEDLVTENITLYARWVTN